MPTGQICPFLHLESSTATRPHQLRAAKATLVAAEMKRGLSERRSEAVAMAAPKTANAKPHLGSLRQQDVSAPQEKTGTQASSLLVSHLRRRGMDTILPPERHAHVLSAIFELLSRSPHLPVPETFLTA